MDAMISRKSSPSPLQQIKTALGMMATFRGAKPGLDALTMYAHRIVRDIPKEFELEDAVSAMEKFADLERGEGDLAFPEVGTLLKMAAIQRVARLNRETLESERALVVWICHTCGYRKSGFLTRLDSAYRTCRSHWGPLLPVDAPRVNGERPERVQLEGGKVCGAVLRVQTDDRRVA